MKTKQEREEYARREMLLDELINENARLKDALYRLETNFDILAGMKMTAVLDETEEVFHMKTNLSTGKKES